MVLEQSTERRENTVESSCSAVVQSINASSRQRSSASPATVSSIWLAAHMMWRRARPTQERASAAAIVVSSVILYCAPCLLSLWCSVACLALLRVLFVGPVSCTVVDGVGPSSATSPAVAPGAGCGACCAPPSGVLIVASATPALPSSAPALPPPSRILDRNRFRVVVCFPDGPPAVPGADFGACCPTQWLNVSARADFCVAHRNNSPLPMDSLSPFTIFFSISIITQGNRRGMKGSLRTLGCCVQHCKLANVRMRRATWT